MPIAFKLEASGPLRLMQKLEANVRSRNLLPLLGRSVANMTKDHLRRMNQERANKLGGRRTNFYNRAAQSTGYAVQPAGVQVTVSHLGYAQRVFGGPIRPVRRKWLTIPVHKDAYGRDPRKMDLIFVPRTSQRALLVFKKPRRGNAAATVAFVLRKSVDQKGDKRVAPSDKQVRDTLTDTLDKALKR